MGDLCRHKTGDYIQGSWVCAACYRILSGRPKRYGMGVHDGQIRQEVVWEAEIATAYGVGFSTFVGWMVGLVRRRSLFTISKYEALKLCLEALADQGEIYGSSDAGWGRADAKEIVKECIFSYWDDGMASSNV